MLNVMLDDRAMRIGVDDCDIVHITETAVANITGKRMGGSITIPISEGAPSHSEIKDVRSILRLHDVTEEITVSELVTLSIALGQGAGGGLQILAILNRWADH